MARVPEIIRRRNISQVAPKVERNNGAWGAIAELAKLGEQTVMPAAMQEAQEQGLNAVYRDENGKLQTETKSPLGGPLADAHNSAAQAKYLSQRSIDMGENFTELAVKYQFDPAGFKEASKLYVDSLMAEEGVPPLLQEKLRDSAEREASARFNGIYRQQVSRDQSEADRNTKTQRDMLADDYLNLIQAGDIEGAEKVYEEILEVSKYRSDAAYISETPAETEAYLRGTRGAARAAEITQRLEGLIGVDEITDEAKAELEELLKDPDLAPSVRARLQIATQGRLKGIEAKGLVNGLTDGSYEGRVIGAESAGKNTAKNPNSTAYGPHQFVKGTWLELVKRHKPAWAKGLSNEEILLRRGDRQISSQMFQYFRQENQQVLFNAGIPINPGTEYLAHFLGAGGAVDVLSQLPTTEISAVLPQKVINANPFLKGMTVADIQNWAARKMTMKSSDIAGQRVMIDQIEDTELRAMASQALNEQFDIRRRFEQTAAAEYDQRLASGDDTLTEQEVFNDHDLSDADQQSIVSKLREIRQDQIEVNQVVSDLNDPEATIDIFDKKQREGLNKAYEASLDGASPLSEPEHVATAAGITERAGLAPRKMYDALRAGVTSDDPEVLANVLEVGNAMLNASNNAFQGYAGQKDFLNKLTDYRRLAEFMPPVDAAAKAMELWKERPKNVQNELKEAVKTLEFSDLTGSLDKWFTTETIGVKGDHDVKDLMPAHLEASMMGEYRELFTAHFLELGDGEAARARAVDDIGRIYGPNVITGKNRIMKYPPQSVYPAVNGSYDWMQPQIIEEVTGFLAEYQDGALLDRIQDGEHWLEEGQRGLLTGEPKRKLEAKDVFLVSNDQTVAEYKRNEKPSYEVYVMIGDSLERLPQRFYFGPSEAQQQARDQFSAKRSEFEAGVGNPQAEFYDNVEKYGFDRAMEMMRGGGDAVPR